MFSKAGYVLLFLGVIVALSPPARAQEHAPTPKAGSSSTSSDGGAPLASAVAGAKNAERALYLYERVERLETRKGHTDSKPQSVHVTRVVPAGTGLDKIPLGPDGKPTDLAAYRKELDKLLSFLNWASTSGPQQREAYQKLQRKQKERDDLIEATRTAFIYTFVSKEPHSGRMLSKYRFEPNPSFKSTNRATAIFARVKGYVLVDDSSRQLARVEGEVTEDISIGVFIAKIYRGSTFKQERQEIAPGLWMPAFSQYDFDGRKFFSSFGVHEKTYYTNYKRVGTPAEAIPQIESEIAQLDSAKSKSAQNR